MEKKMKSYIVDAFTDTLFKGNPAAVCVLDEWLSDVMMQNIAKENNLSETAFTVANGNSFDLRWFTPGGEIDLCGHATLATAYVITHFVDSKLDTLVFNTKSGVLIVEKKDKMLEMDMPAYVLKPVPVSDEMEAAIGYRPVESRLGRDLVGVLENEV
jgi:PhzF family phenazine biosynthesis protein